MIIHKHQSASSCLQCDVDMCTAKEYTLIELYKILCAQSRHAMGNVNLYVWRMGLNLSSKASSVQSVVIIYIYMCVCVCVCVCVYIESSFQIAHCNLHGIRTK